MGRESMARRKKGEEIDWVAIERQYRLGQKTNLQLASEYGIDHSGISKRAKRYGWIQDKSEEVRQTTDSLLIHATAGNGKIYSQPTPLEIKAAAQTNADVILGHRHGLRRLRTLQAKLVDHLESIIDNFGDLGEVVIMVRQEDDRGIDRANDALRKAVERSSVVDDLKKLSEVDERIRKGEREAFGLDDKDKQATPFETLLDRLGDVASKVDGDA